MNEDSTVIVTLRDYRGPDLCALCLADGNMIPASVEAVRDSTDPAQPFTAHLCEPHVGEWVPDTFVVYNDYRGTL